MTMQTPTQTSAPTPSASLAPPTGVPGLLHPVGMQELSKRELYREFLRWPTVLWLPAIVAVLTVIGLHSYVAAVPCAIALATAATLFATHRACARLISRNATAAIAAQIPTPRSGRDR